MKRYYYTTFNDGETFAGHDKPLTETIKVLLSDDPWKDVKLSIQRDIMETLGTDDCVVEPYAHKLVDISDSLKGIIKLHGHLTLDDFDISPFTKDELSYHKGFQKTHVGIIPEVWALVGQQY